MKHDYKAVATLCLDKVNAHRMIYADAAEGEPLALAAWSFSRRQPQSIEILVIKRYETYWLQNPAKMLRVSTQCYTTYIYIIYDIYVYIYIRFRLRWFLTPCRVTLVGSALPTGALVWVPALIIARVRGCR